MSTADNQPRGVCLACDTCAAALISVRLPPCLQLHGVCLGMEALSVAVSQNHSILSDYDSENLPSPIFLTGEALRR